MAKIVIEFDTVTKKATASMDGVAVQNLSSMNLYRSGYDSDEEGFSCSLTSALVDKENKLGRSETVYASEQKSVQDDIRNWFAGKSAR